MSSKACKSCGGTDVDVDHARGIVVCTNCGAVLEENCIVSEVQFEENAYGGASAIGQFVSNENQGGTGFINSYRGGNGKQSREITMKRAREKITTMGQQLNLNQHCIDMAVNFYGMALQRHLTNGRKSAHVVAACIYITCRMEGTAHLLIDIADVIDIDVYTLGHTFMQIAKMFNLSIPSVDPCLYVMRYANRMNFGDKTHEVSRSALRLVQRMKRDWIHTGRRPSGLCGAALLIAARYHGFNRTVIDVIKEVKVHENTVRKRMQEFGETASSSLTLEEFMQVDLEEEHDPPAFLKSRKKDRIDEIEEESTEEMVELEKEINRQIALSLAKKRGPYAKYAKEALAIPDSPIAGPSRTSSPSTDPEVEDVIADMTMTAVKECLTPTEAAAVDANSLPTARKTTSDTDESILMPPPGATYLQLRHHLRPSLASLGIFSGSVEKEELSKQDEAPPDSGELDLEGIDDSEMDSYIKTEDEAKMTTDMWMALNGEFMKELEAKQKRKAEEEEEKQKRGEKRKRKTARRQPQQSYSGSTPGEAIGKMLIGKRISNKINYDKLKDLDFSFAPSSSLSDSGPSTSTASDEPVVETKPSVSSSTRSSGAKVNLSATKPRGSATKSETKPQKEQLLPPSPPPPQPEDMYEDEEEEEEEEIESVGNLLNNFNGDGGYGDDYDEY
ncbi:transcription factor IIIB 90 kDa subunit-like [Daphnia pulicaria]|uniref:transcription factor IIIB 90 kDa subunit-like n=1 Tax=Daphnia pulicaria TaxID=35523 RepID=UPI001EEADD4C|nr:transcription factor IIIB 90 kDa subunit-like [Daphnia pulicaria]XP_046651656.1 transcription factor IIIB 90 kDa subunit-like [Daphnia pulicaria]